MAPFRVLKPTHTHYLSSPGPLYAFLLISQPVLQTFSMASKPVTCSTSFCPVCHLEHNIVTCSTNECDNHRPCPDPCPPTTASGAIPKQFHKALPAQICGGVRSSKRPAPRVPAPRRGGNPQVCVDPRDGAPVSPEDTIRFSPNKIQKITIAAEIDKDRPNKATIEVLTSSGCSKEIHCTSSKTGKFATESDWELHPTKHNKQTL